MYKVTITMEGKPLLQDIVDRKTATILYNALKNVDRMNINIIRFIADPEFKIKDLEA